MLKTSDLDGWLSRGKNPKWKIVAVGLPAYCTLHTLLESARANSAGLLLSKYFLDYGLTLLCAREKMQHFAELAAICVTSSVF